ncbi:MAG: alpha/beta hydrolase [Deferrisomatales bacterium]|nr:alpha/beta hydrolase [Deferrisomatales bacterium]
MRGGARGPDALDRPEILARLFHPRRDARPPPQGALDLSIPLADGEVLGARFHPSVPDRPSLLFFHGNGEVAADYDDVGPLFASAGWNFVALDYRGYGRSSGRPTAAALLADARAAFPWVRAWLAERGCTGSVAVFGRSLGSAPALELAAGLGWPAVAGLVLDSAFARELLLLEALGIDGADLGLTEADGFRNLDKVRRYGGPTLVLHGARDRLIPPEDGRALFDASAAQDKRLVLIPGADHNSLFLHGLETYLGALGDLARKVRRGTGA